MSKIEKLSAGVHTVFNGSVVATWLSNPNIDLEQRVHAVHQQLAKLHNPTAQGLIVLPKKTELWRFGAQVEEARKLGIYFRLSPIADTAEGAARIVRDIKKAATRQRINLRRGFSLIEAAIVLGVVGLVIGGIWIAASAVNENLKINRLVNDTLYVATEVRKIISYSDGSQMANGAGMAGNLFNANVFPASYRRQGPHVFTPDGNRIEIIISNFTAHSVLTVGFSIRIYGLSSSECAKYSTRITSINADYNTRASAGIEVYTVTGFQRRFSYVRNFPVEPAEAITMCEDPVERISYLTLPFNYQRTI